ncbi:MAG: phosphoenolpyruvate carboxykinase (ATP) [Saprospiraceae bacterium]|nr:phosphoenolpyruvate carboxykinase (ATP) [Saprospiraceae bacterium]
MPNINITTHPTGRSPENKYFFGEQTKDLDLSRPKYNKIGEGNDFADFYALLQNQTNYLEPMNFETVGTNFTLHTNDERHKQFVWNMFKVTAEDQEGDWTIWHNTSIEMEPKIYVHLDKKLLLIAGTTFLGEIKKGVFGIVSFELPKFGILPMHCGAFTYRKTTNLMFGLSGTGKTTLSSDPDYKLISDDEVAWTNMGIKMIETGCYAKSEGLTPETHETIFNAVEVARLRDTLVEENPEAANARLSYPISCIENAYHKRSNFHHADNIFFLTMDAEGVFPAISRISGKAVRRFFETGYTSTMPGTEAGVTEIQRTLSPCYGSPFMPRSVKTYSDLLMANIKKHNSNVFLVNTGMNPDTGERFALDFTRNTVKQAITTEYPLHDTSETVLNTLEQLIGSK